MKRRTVSFSISLWRTFPIKFQKMQGSAVGVERGFSAINLLKAARSPPAQSNEAHQTADNRVQASLASRAFSPMSSRKRCGSWFSLTPRQFQDARRSSRVPLFGIPVVPV